MNSLNEYWYIYFSIGLVIIIGVVIAVICVSQHRKKKEKKQNKIDQSDFISAWVAALGGELNIHQVTIKGNKLEVYLNNFEKIDKPLLSQLGVTSTIQEAHKLTISYDGDIQEIENLLSPYIKG